MRSLPVRAFLAIVFVAFALTSCVDTGQQRPGKTTAARPDYESWPHEASDVTPDPAVRYGVLPNGFRYAIMRNTQPSGVISLRLRIASGSLQEDDAQRGLAHFMEHMAFNGSKNVPEGEYVKLLQRKGLAFGAHTNAFTSTDQTVYMLELPKNDADMVDTGLMLFREIGDRLTLDPAAIEREKGVVLSEQRSRNTPEFRAYETRWRLWYEGQRLAERLPIGTVETIKGANRDLLADYYRRFYRPERALFVAVGDFDPADIEAKVKAKFADWKGEGAPTVDPEQGPVKKRGLVARSHVEANLPESVIVSWFQPPDDAPDTFAERERNAKRNVAFEVVNRRLARIAREPNAPFVAAGIGRSITRGTSNALTLSVSARPGQWRTAMNAVEQELRRALEYGFHQSEVDREVKAWRAGLEDDVAKATTRRTANLANAVVSEFASRGVFSNPSVDLAHFEKYAPTLTPDVARDFLREIAQGEGPVVFVSSASPINGGDAAVAAAFEENQKTAVAALEKTEAKEFPYTAFGTPGTVSERREVEDIGVTMVRFANGVRLTIKPTKFEKDTIYVNTRFAGGYIHMPRNKVGLNWALPFGFIEGGMKKLTTDELEEALTGRIVSVDLDVDEDSFAFDGRTNTRDLLLQMQLTAAFVTDPAYRGNGLERLQGAAENFIKQYSSSPSRVISREVPSLLRSNDPRWAFPSLKQMQALTIADVQSTMKPVLSNAPIEVSMVGDVDVDAAIEAVGATLGALPARAETLAEPKGARDVHFPAAKAARTFTHEGPADQASAYAAWPAPDFFSNTRRARTIALLREMIKVRLTDEFREAQGATYSPSVGSWHSGALPGFGYLSATAETRPELVDGFYKTLDEIVTELKTGAFTDDLVARARTPMLKSIETDRRTNSFWVRVTEDLQTEPRGLDAIRTQISDVEGITNAELVDAAKTYLDPARRIDIRVLPQKRQASVRPAKAAEPNRALVLQD